MPRKDKNDCFSVVLGNPRRSFRQITVTEKGQYRKSHKTFTTQPVSEPLRDRVLGYCTLSQHLSVSTWRQHPFPNLSEASKSLAATYHESQSLDTVKIISVNIHTHTHKLLSGSSAPPVWWLINTTLFMWLLIMWLTESRWTGWYAVCSEFAAKNTTLSTDSAEPCYQHFVIDSKESLTPAPRRVGILIRCCLTVTVSTVKWCVCGVVSPINDAQQTLLSSWFPQTTNKSQQNSV